VVPGADILSTAKSSIIALDSIVERIDLSAAFPQTQPLEVELGSGDGTFLVKYAERHPERNFIGVERLLGRIRKMDRKVQRAALTNVRGVRIESAYFLEYLLRPHSALAVHVYFPDPWPKQKHRRHRLVNERFPELVRQALVEHGKIFFRTDDESYFKQMLAIFGTAPGFREIRTPDELMDLVTDFETEFQQQGVDTLRVGFELME
jgi:tRNA (guanine-N7-)-methyltransferase